MGGYNQHTMLNQPTNNLNGLNGVQHVPGIPNNMGLNPMNNPMNQYVHIN